MQTISSTKNAAVQKLAQLKTKKGRQEQGLYFVEGARLLREAMLQKADISMLAVSDAKEAAELVRYAESINAVIFMATDSVLHRICDTENPQGVAAAIRIPETRKDFGNTILALDGIADPGNLGTMLRSAAAFGITDVILSYGCADAFSPKCVRAGMGAHFRLHIHEENLPASLLQLRMEDYSVIGASVDGREMLPPMGEKRVFVIGSEAFGLSDDVKSACTGLYRIPMSEGSESLNAAVAAGILLFLGFRS